MADNFVQALLATSDGELPWGVGTVTAVNDDGTLQVAFRGRTLDGIRRLTSYPSPAADDVVIVVHGDGQAAVLGAFA